MALHSALILFHGNTGTSPLERAVANDRVAAAVEHAHLAREGGFDAVIIATDEIAAFTALEPAPWLHIEADATPSVAFRIRDQLLRLLKHHPAAAIAVMGAGSLPLFGAEDFRALLAGAQQGRIATNNFFSADITAWRPASALQQLHDFDRDNQLPRRLRDDAALQVTVLPRSTRTQFDLDTPVDAAILRLWQGSTATCGSGHLEQQLDAVMNILVDPAAELVVAGRVGSQAWQYLERETACRVRMYSEERGLAAAGPSHRARSLLGGLIELEGPAAFFDRMAELGDALVLDTRVLEAHMGVAPSRADRFRSDVFEWEEIEDEFLRDFTRAAGECRVPVLLGGHSLVSGGLMLLNDVAWRRHDETLAARNPNA